MKYKMRSLVAVLLCLMFVMTGCTTKTEPNPSVEEKTEVSRIISTSPSNTEILVGLGLTDKLVAVDTYSTDIEGLSAEIPQLELSNPDAETILGLKPDLIITSEINQVGNAENPFSVLEESGITVLYMPTSTSIEGIYSDIEKIAAATGTVAQGEALISGMKEKVSTISEIAATIPESERKTVYFEISPAPSLFTFGQDTFLNEIIELVGATNIFGNETGWISPSEETILKDDPDVILSNVNYIENPIEEIKGRAGWENLTAVKENQIFMINTNAASRPSQNVIIALEEMAQAIYPTYYE